MRSALRLFLTRRALAVAALMLAGGGFSAQAALIALTPTTAAPAPVAARPIAPPVAAAALVAGAEQAAPAAGTTGTAALPDLPQPTAAASLTGDGSVRPAQPFSLAGASTEARTRALSCLTAAVYYEAASESADGQRAVAQVVLNRVRHPAFPASVCGVVYQGSDRTSGCQFSFACDGALARAASPTGWARASRIAAAALNGYVMGAVGEATHYHTYAVTPAWNRSLVMTAAIGAHFFHRWQGYWGTPAAFGQHYAKVEPFPGPAPRTPALVAAMAGPPILAAAPAARSTLADGSRPSGDPAVTAAAGSLPETTMLPKWQGTGQPLK